MLRRCALGENLSHGRRFAVQLAGQKLLQLADILHVRQLIAFKSDSERLLDAEHQIDMRHGIPAFDIGGFHLIAQLKRIIVEYLAKDFFQSIVQLDELLTSCG